MSFFFFFFKSRLENRVIPPCVVCVCVCVLAKPCATRALLLDLTSDEVCEEVGMGTFGRVLECWDKGAGRMVAIKV